MPRTLALAISSDTGDYLDTIRVRVMDSADSHDRPPAATNLLVYAVQDEIYKMVQEDDYFVQQNGTIMIHGRTRMLFRRPNANEPNVDMVLFHIDMTRSQKASQMEKRNAAYEKKFGGGGGSSSSSGLVNKA